jgi:hypothetical protein
MLSVLSGGSVFWLFEAQRTAGIEVEREDAGEGCVLCSQVVLQSGMLQLSMQVVCSSHGCILLSARSHIGSSRAVVPFIPLGV